MDITKHLSDILSHPTSIAALIGLLLIIVVLMKFKKVKLDTRMIVLIGISLALATILKMFKLYHWPQGGSVTPGSMVPILLIAFIYGPETGFLTGLLFGLITLILDPYILHPVQVLFDYPLPFVMLGLAGYFDYKKTSTKLLGAFVAIFGRFICHFISGIVFFGSYAPKGTSPAVYSLMVNGPIVGVDGLICLVILSMLPINQLAKIALKKYSLQN
ncbi:energy-coupled thiamine transporter ThiT [Haloimpatiens sp. FM7330]|uniref:energy-coupled thiamine transporter ThiT n=1 Tax=Haloimpatiens sp. FM7330 TaxID=3298610 RepID=UPI00363E81CA